MYAFIDFVHLIIHLESFCLKRHSIGTLIFQFVTLNKMHLNLFILSFRLPREKERQYEFKYKYIVK